MYKNYDIKIIINRYYIILIYYIIFHIIYLFRKLSKEIVRD